MAVPVAEEKKESRPRHLNEFEGHSEEEKDALRKYNETYQEAEEYVRPHFDKALRMDNLYNGVLPEEIDCSFSKVMLPIANSIVENELPRQASTILSSSEFAKLYANEARHQFGASAATNWLMYTAMKKNRLFPRIIPTLQRVGVIGTGYRVVSHDVTRKIETERVETGSFAGIPTGFKDKEKIIEKMGIYSQNADFYSVLPAPNGTFVNTNDNDAEEAVEYLHWITYMSKAKLESMRSARFANKEEITRMINDPKSKSSEGNIDQEYRQQKADSAIGIQTPDWMSSVREGAGGAESRWRCVWSWYRDEWMLVGENKYLLYKGPPLLDWFPLSKYVGTMNQGEWFGRGLIEPAEDIILSYLLTFNYRMDYLTTTLHPTKFVRSDVVKTNGGDINDFDPTPYGLFTFSQRVKNIQEAIWYDRFPDISPQAFMEENSFKQMLQEATGQPNYMKGMGGEGTLANETATGIVSLIEEGTARSTMRSLIIEHLGLHDELMLMLKWGNKYVWEDQEVEIMDDTGTFSWRDVPPEVIHDGYGIELKGTKELGHRSEVIKRMMTILPMLANNPNVPGQQELLRQTLEQMGAYVNIPKILETSPDGGGTLGPDIAGHLGGGAQTATNEAQAVGGAIPQAGQQIDKRFSV